ncbi:hypothetical protein HOBO_169 [Bacillus phage Hobo]|uniref:Uncharacterized protein n=2 Tax=Caeruleovirus BM15 TaxID=1985178 RepID=A0A0S2MUP8_9CAUD|nr:hypothetical protein FD732_gp173 [Bacillus phage BM15]ALO79576.1 hypothetical protein BM10_172 [Bacillus phage BM15]AXQ66927.1 hypothetical protein HOBO_169 [Bacillus phage Hobo]
MESTKLFSFVYYKDTTLVGSSSGFYEDETDATKKAQQRMGMYHANVVEIHSYNYNAGIFSKFISITSKRNDIKWKDTFNARNILGKDFYECQNIAKSVGYKYLLFNGQVYSVTGSINNELCEEKDLIV